MSQVKTSAVKATPAPPGVRTLPLVEEEHRRLEPLARQLEARIAQNKRLIAESEEGMSLPGQQLSEVHRLASLKSACEISIAADIPALSSLVLQMEDLSSEHRGITRNIQRLLA